eukprot:COSAG01_NODE_63785_length_278_cov_3.581006_1_plen_40_part_01
MHLGRVVQHWWRNFAAVDVLNAEFLHVRDGKISCFVVIP